ncbi:hypothetical protein KIN20_021472 [Parelaphostrongylus tenuis]|uniref:Uncharacterized protein n=1 Tax=Parelaphostrongylus tenuis TaxID=148309 RepID=A0AAD5N5B0_PARTN|nr:hypothetical protein KIN20_021472 [Parelaphostrongylus tenuis]
MISVLATISIALGCGVMPAGQASTMTFTVTGITTLPVAMAYSDKPEVSAQVPGITSTKDGAKAFVSRLVMQTIIDVLKSQARSALLPDVVISAILDQLSVRVTYEPVPCQMVVLDVTKDTMMKKNDQFCIIIGNTVTGVCTGIMDGLAGRRAGAMCTDAGKATIGPVPTNHTSVSGTLMTTNIIMANWSRQMWQSVLNRAIRMLALVHLDRISSQYRAMSGETKIEQYHCVTLASAAMFESNHLRTTIAKETNGKCSGVRIIH